MVFVIENEKKIYKIRALDRRILVVASVTKGVGDWAAYIGVTYGEEHRVEFMKVVDYGSKIDKGLAKHLFPHFALKYIWRD